METSNCWMALPLLFSFQSEAFLVKGENPGEIFFWEKESDAEVLEHQELLSDPIARSTDLLKRSPMVDFFILKTHKSKQCSGNISIRMGDAYLCSIVKS